MGSNPCICWTKEEESQIREGFEDEPIYIFQKEIDLKSESEEGESYDRSGRFSRDEIRTNQGNKNRN
jgi:hypothetical protein